MSITPDRKTELIKDYAVADGDTGSPEVQVVRVFPVKDLPPLAFPKDRTIIEAWVQLQGTLRRS